MRKSVESFLLCHSQSMAKTCKSGESLHKGSVESILQTSYRMVIFCSRSHKRHPRTPPGGGVMGCFFMSSEFVEHTTFVFMFYIHYSLLCYIGPWYIWRIYNILKLPCCYCICAYRLGSPNSSWTGDIRCAGTPMVSLYCQVSNIRRTWVGNEIVDQPDVVGALPVGHAPTTSLFSTEHLASIYCTKTTASRVEKHLSFAIWCDLY